VSEMNIVYILVNILIGVLGFLLRQHLITLKDDVKEIKTQVNLTNGRVSVHDVEIKGNTNHIETLTRKLDELWAHLWKWTNKA